MFQNNVFGQKLIEKALKDEAFRKLLIDSPAEAIEIETGVKIPESVNIRILEEDPQTIYLVLPYIPSTEAESELSEAELTDVAGGVLTVWAGCSVDYVCQTFGWSAKGISCEGHPACM